ncbi:MAG TPA: hypothetical protein VIR30_21595, partial [Nocardioides sp.]
STRRTKYVAAGSPYQRECEAVIARLDALEASGISADDVAETILAAVRAERPRSLHARGSNARVVFALKRIAPRSLVEAITARKFGIRH